MQIEVQIVGVCRVNSYDVVDQFQQEHDRLHSAWDAAYTRYGTADGALASTLTAFAERDSRFESQSAHSNIARVKQALDELQQIQKQLQAALDRVDASIR